MANTTASRMVEQRPVGFRDCRRTCLQHGIVPGRMVVTGALRAALTMRVGNRFCGMAVRKRVNQRRVVSPAEAAAVGVLIAADLLQQSFAAICESHDITTDQYRVLRILRDAPPTGYARGEVAARCMHRSPDMTRMIDRLVGQGFAKRRVDPRPALLHRDPHPDGSRLAATRRSRNRRRRPAADKIPQYASAPAARASHGSRRRLTG